jgi:hypothetical protein
MRYRLAAVATTLLVISSPLTGQDGRSALGIFSPPETPAAALLGLEPHLVQRPGITTDFLTSLISATNSLSVLPQSYAVAFAPYWVFGGGKEVRFHDYIRSADLGTNIAQSLMISLATTGESDGVAGTDGAAVSVGFQLSLLRGNIADDAVRQLAVSLQGATIGAEATIDSILAASARYQELEAGLEAVTEPSQILPLQQELERIRSAATDSVTRWMNEERALRDEVGSLWAERTGWVVDMAGGAVLDFADRSFRAGELSRWGFWLTGGYEAPNVSLLGVARFLANDPPRAEPNALDLGGRLSLTGSDRFALSAEVAWRRYPDSPRIQLIPAMSGVFERRVYDDEWRGVLNLEFAIARGKTVSFAFGQDFDANANRDDLIALLRLLVGFGADRVPAAPLQAAN